MGKNKKNENFEIKKLELKNKKSLEITYEYKRTNKYAQPLTHDLNNSLL